MGLNLDASPEELKLFLEEVEEHFQSLEDNLLKLEKEESFNEDLLQEIFRSSHTLKGSSATIGHKRMAELTHFMENVLDKLRKQQLSVSSHLVDVLFESLDCLRTLKDEIINDEESDLDLSVIIGKLSSLQDDPPGEESKTQSAEADKSPDTVQAIDLNLSWEERDAVHQAADQGFNPLMIQLEFNVEQEMLAVRAFVTLMAIGEFGDIVKSEPTSEDIEHEQVGTTLKLLLLTQRQPEDLEKLIKELPSIGSWSVALYVDPEDTGIRTAENAENAADEAAASSVDTPVEKAEAPQVQENKTPQQSKAAPALKKANRTVRVDVDLLDSLMNLVGELVIDRTRLFQILVNIETNYEMDDVSDDLSRTSVHIARVTSQLQEHIMKARMLPVENLFNKFPRMIRDLSQKAGKELDFVMTGQETELDRSIIEEIGDPLIHLLRNAVDHGLEPPEERTRSGKKPVGELKLMASHEENHIIITIKDDGRGINPESIRASAVKKGIISEEQGKRLTDKESVNLIFVSGLSTAKTVTDVSGRGVGMDVVRTNIEKINGAIEINSVLGQGTEFKIKLPLTLAIIRALLVSIGKSIFAIPLSTITETIRLQQEQIEYINNQEVIVVRGNVLPLIRMNKVFATSNSGEGLEDDKIFVVVVNLAGQQIGLVVDSLVGEQEIVIKSLGKYIGDVQGISGATILGDGNVALIVDIPNLVKKAAS